MSEKIIAYAAIASIVSGLVYWIVEFWFYFVEMLGAGKIPFDAFIMLVPIIIVSVGSGLFICVPIYLLLYKFSIDKTGIILTMSVLMAICIINTILAEWNSGYEVYVHAAVSGLFGGLAFSYLLNKRNQI